MYKILKQINILPIIRGDFPKIEKIIETLFEAGVKTVEVTMNSPGIEKTLPKICKKFGQKILIGTGTVYNKTLAQKAISLGAQFLIAPNLDPKTISFCQKNKIPLIPGVMTPSEVAQALNLGVSFLKLFPASFLGPNYLKHLKGPFDQASFMAVGGINLQNANQFVKAGAEALGIGDDLIDKEAIAKNRFDIIKKKACLFLKIFSKEKW